MKKQILFLIFFPLIIILNAMEQAEYKLGAGEPEFLEYAEQEPTAITELGRPAKRSKIEGAPESLTFAETQPEEIRQEDIETESEEEIPAPEYQVEEPLEAREPQQQIANYQLRTIDPATKVGPIYSIGLSTNKQYVTILERQTDSWPSRARSFNFNTGEVDQQNITKYHEPGQTTISCDGNSIVNISGRTIYKQNIGSAPIKITGYKKGTVQNIAESCDGRYIILLNIFPSTPSRTPFLLIYNNQTQYGTENGFPLPENFFEKFNQRLIISPQNQYIVGFYYKGLYIYDFNEKFIGKLEHQNQTNTPAVAITNDDKYLIAGWGDGKIQIYNLPSLQQIQTFPADDQRIAAIALSPDGNFIITGSGSAVKIWNFAGDLQQTLTVPNDAITALTIAQDGTIVAGSARGIIYIFEPTGAVA